MANTTSAQIGACDPSKSGSVAKAFEMIIHQKMRDTVVAAGFDDAAIARFEKLIDDHRAAQGPKYKRGDLPPAVPPAYQAAVERGWVAGVRLVQLIGANARYFTDSAQKVPIDVSAGDKIPRKGGPGITRSDLLVINKIDLAPLVGASLDVMERDARKMRGARPFIFTNLKSGQGVAEVARMVEETGGLSA